MVLVLEYIPVKSDFAFLSGLSGKFQFKWHQYQRKSEKKKTKKKNDLWYGCGFHTSKITKMFISSKISQAKVKVHFITDVFYRFIVSICHQLGVLLFLPNKTKKFLNRFRYEV